MIDTVEEELLNLSRFPVAKARRVQVSLLEAAVSAPSLQVFLSTLDPASIDENLWMKVKIAKLLLARERKKSPLVPLGDVVVFLVFCLRHIVLTRSNRESEWHNKLSAITTFNGVQSVLINRVGYLTQADSHLREYKGWPSTR
jgi:hypothetical protein